MRIYLAGTFPGGVRRSAGFQAVATPKDVKTLTTYPYYLESYHYIGKNATVLRDIREQKVKVFLDSGAFSSFTQGITIDLERYCDFIKANEDIVEVSSVLDGIGDPELTLVNQSKMEDLGVKPLPCFHYGEDTKYLEHYIENYDHITLGGMVPISTPDLLKWLDFIWGNFLTDKNGLAKIKVHGFGLTVIRLMNRYPWYSVDSTSWVMTSRFGSIYYPTPQRPEQKLCISDQSPKTKEAGMHFDTMSEIEREAVLVDIEAKGYVAEDLRSIYWKRDLWNIDYFKGLCDGPPTPFINKEKGLFD